MSKIQTPSITPFQTANGRYYRTPAGHLPSVTTVLEKTASQEDQERLRKWRHKLNQFHGTDSAAILGTEAKSRGTRLHEAIAQYLTGEFPKLDEEIAPYWEQAKPIVKALTNPRHCEQRVYHPEYRYAGTLDLVADWQGRPTVIDWKTSYRMKKLSWLKDHQLQCAAYSKAYQWMYQSSIEQTLIVILSPEKAQLFVFEADEISQHWQMWQNRLNQFYSRSHQDPPQCSAYTAKRLGGGEAAGDRRGSRLTTPKKHSLIS